MRLKRALLKYLSLGIISLGILLFPIAIIGFEYTCSGTEMMPVYFGTPFIYKSTSLATSMAYDYYLIGFLANWVIWYFIFLIIYLAIYKSLLKNNKSAQLIFKGIIGVLLLFSIIWVGLSIDANEGGTVNMHINLKEKAKTWGVTCEGKIIFFR